MQHLVNEAQLKFMLDIMHRKHLQKSFLIPPFLFVRIKKKSESRHFTDVVRGIIKKSVMLFKWPSACFAGEDSKMPWKLMNFFSTLFFTQRSTFPGNFLKVM